MNWSKWLPRMPLAVVSVGMVVAVASGANSVAQPRQAGTSSAAQPRQVAYVSLQGYGRVAVYDVDGQTGAWSLKQTVEARPGKEGWHYSAPMAVSPDGRRLHVSNRGAGTLVTFAIANDGLLTVQGTSDIGGSTNYLVRDKTGRWLLASYNPDSGGTTTDKVMVHRIDEQGLITAGSSREWTTARLPHSLRLDPSNRFLFVPHTRSNAIHQFRFDAEKGTLERNDPAVLSTPGRDPRHLHFHPRLDVAYFINESHSSITAYHLDPKKGTLTEFQNIPTLPLDPRTILNHMKKRGEINMTADIHVTPDGRFLYGSNRGHDSIAAFSVDPSTGKLAIVDWFETEPGPRAFTLDSTGRFLYVAGMDSNKIAAYQIERHTGRLTRFATYEVGPAPSWIEVLALK